jgi:hypothetical protein
MVMTYVVAGGQKVDRMLSSLATERLRGLITAL